MTANLDRLNRTLLQIQDMLEDAVDQADGDPSVGDIADQINLALSEVEVAITYTEEEMSERSLGDYGVGSTL